MTEKTPKKVCVCGSELTCKSTAELKNEVQIELIRTDGSLHELLKEKADEQPQETKNS